MSKADKPSQSRRKFLKTSAVAGTAASVGPWVVSPKVFASSGEVNVTMWTDYIPAPVIEEFKAKTGIPVTYTALGYNEELINQMKATKGAGVDLFKKLGDSVEKDEPLYRLYAEFPSDFKFALALCEEASGYTIGQQADIAKAFVEF